MVNAAVKPGSVLLLAGIIALGTVQVPAAAVPPPTLRVHDVSVAELNRGGQVARVRIVLSRTLNRDVTVRYRMVDVSAKAGRDYTAKSGTIAIPSGTGSTTIRIRITGDARDEVNETFRVQISAPVRARIADPSGTVTIRDNDAAPRLRAGNATVVEPDAASATMSLPVSLSRASGKQVNVRYSLVARTATRGADYRAAESGVLRFRPGTTRRSVRVTVLNDTGDEQDEELVLTLVTAINARVADRTGVGRIRDDDGPALSVDNVPVTEGNSAVWTLLLSEPSPQPVTVDFATGNGAATAPGDYTRRTGSRTIPALALGITITVPTAGDTVDEVDEAFVVRLSGVSGATIADGVGRATINDDDGPTISIDDAARLEGWQAANQTFAVRLSASSPQPVTVSYAATPGTAESPSDFAAGSGALTFAPGQTSESVTVQVAGDLAFEPDETFTVSLAGPVDGTIADGTAVGMITDDDCDDGDEGRLAATDMGTVSGDSGAPAVTEIAEICGGDADWYMIELTETVDDAAALNDLAARVELTVADNPAQTVGDLTMEVFSSDGTSIGTSEATGTTDETFLVKKADSFVLLDDTVDTTTFFVKVVPSGAMVNDYTLTVTGNVTTAIAPNL